MAPSCVAARPQDASSVPETNVGDASAVDASVHADVDNGAKQQQGVRQSKRTAPYSKWGFSSASSSPDSPFRGAQATTRGHAESTSTFGGPSVPPETPTNATESAIKPAKGGYSRRPDRRPNLYGGVSTDRLHDPSTGSQLSGIPLQPPAAQPEVLGFSAPFRGKPLAGMSTPSFASPFPKTTYSSNQDRPKAKSHEPLSKKPGQKTQANAIPASSIDPKEKIGSPLTAKPQ
jgi:hypothetical protein